MRVSGGGVKVPKNRKDKNALFNAQLNKGDGGVIIIGSGYLRLPLSEHSCKVHCDQAHYGPVSGGGAEVGFNCCQVVVGSIWLVVGGVFYRVSGGVTDGRQDKVWGVHWFLGKLDEPMLGSADKMEQGGTRAGTQHAQDGRLSCTGTVQSEPEISGREEGDLDRVTKHQGEEGGGTVGGSPRLAAREHRRWSVSGDETNAGDSHALRGGVFCMVNTHGDHTSGGGCSGLEG